MQKRTKALTEAALTTTIIAIVGLSSMYIPLLSLMVFFTFVPLIVLGKKHGFKYAAISLVASALIIGMFAGPIYAISLIILLGSSSLIMGWLLHKEKPTATVIGAGAVAALISMVLVIAFGQMITGIPLIDSIKTIFEESIKMQQSIFEKLGTDPTKVKETINNLTKSRDQILLIIPGAFIVWSVISTYINYFLAIKILKRSGEKVPEITPFRDFMLPKNVLIGTIVIYFLSLFASYMNIVDPKVLMANVQVVIVYTYAIQGVSVTLWYMYRKKMNTFLKVIIIGFVLLSAVGSIIFFMIGVTEIAISIRKRIEFRDQIRQERLK